MKLKINYLYMIVRYRWLWVWWIVNALLKHTSRKSSGSFFIKWSRTNVMFVLLGTKNRNVAFNLRWTRSPDCHFIPLSYWGRAFQWVQLIFGGAFLALFLHWTSMQIYTDSLSFLKLNLKFSKYEGSTHRD